jgi:methionyl-tRNA synthetase
VSCEENYTLTQATKKEDGKLYCRVGHQLSEKEEESYFFKMSKYENWIKDLYANNQSLIYPISRVHELTNSFLNEGLTDLSVSRTSLT